MKIFKQISIINGGYQVQTTAKKLNYELIFTELTYFASLTRCNESGFLAQSLCEYDFSPKRQQTCHIKYLNAVYAREIKGVCTVT